MIRFTLIVSLFICLASDSAVAQFSFFGRQQSAKTISAEQLYQLLTKQASVEKQATEQGQEKPPADFVLVDVRSPKEQAVSMIPGAITAQQFERHRQHYQGRTVITYCTVGGRSEHYARKLIAAGQSAMNFKGSILGWCKAKYPLVTPKGKQTQRVHTYSARYSVPSQYSAVH